MKKGFTLIELLVVVLIIGLLAAIALPQYRVAVAKARFAELMALGDAITKAQELYFMSNGVYAERFDELALQFSGEILLGGTRIKWADKYCDIILGERTDADGVKRNYSEYNCQYLSSSQGADVPGYIRGMRKDSVILCRADSDTSSVKNKVCRSLTAASASCTSPDAASPYCQYVMK